MPSLAILGRLWTFARTLGRFDALIPRELAARLPWRFKALRLVFGSLGKTGGKTGGKTVALGERLRDALQSLGPAAIKLGQVLATRPDIVGDKTAEALSTLQDRLPPFSSLDAALIIAQSFGTSVETLFSRFDEPVAAASVAQVHPAFTTDDPPRKVAVKVLRPGIEAEFRRDLEAFAFAARTAERFSAQARRLRLREVVKVLEDTVALELDLRLEAAAAVELAAATKTDAGFHVPAVDWRRTAQRVLTTEWIDGISIRDRAALIAAGHDPKDIAVRLMRRFMTSALCDGYFHADVHPGNLFVEPSGRLAAVDFGIMGRLDLRTRRFMAAVLLGFLSRDFARAAQAHFDYGTVPADRSVELFAQYLRAIVEPVLDRPVREISMGKLLQQLFETTRRFGMQTQPQLLLLQKTMVVAEGVARSLDPDFDMWTAAKPVAEAWIGEQAGPRARLTDFLEALASLAGRIADWAKTGR
jgi:ubiquinone biosynthesis protein